MTIEQREILDRMLRESPLDLGGSVEEQRRRFDQMMSAQPLPADVTVTAGALGAAEAAVPTAEITVAGVEPRNLLLYFHGGAYVLGSPGLTAELASQVGRRIEARTISVDYRLAPEHPYPAAVDDAVSAYAALLQSGVLSSHVVLGGESAGGGLAVAALVAARDRGLPMPAAALLMSPWTDLTLSGSSMDTKKGVDALLSRESLKPRAADYAAGADLADGLISPIFADLAGLSPLVIQAGSHEVLLDDAVRLAQRAATDDVEVTLDITPGVPHVFQAFHAILDEARAALDRAGELLLTHLRSSELVFE